MELFKRIRKRGGAAAARSGAASTASSAAAAASGAAATGASNSGGSGLARLGKDVLAVRLDSGAEVPAECTAVVIAESGQTRRVGAFGSPRLALARGETAWCFHPGPYVFALSPFAAAAETGLRVEFLIDAGDPRVQQQRFDLYLASEWCSACGPLTVAVFGSFVQEAVRNALTEGMLDLAPCTSIEEWHAFRAGLNELMYTRFGVTVQDCYPIDLHPETDFAATLSTRRISPLPGVAAPSAAAASSAAPEAPAAAVPSAVAAPFAAPEAPAAAAPSAIPASSAAAAAPSAIPASSAAAVRHTDSAVPHAVTAPPGAAMPAADPNPGLRPQSRWLPPGGSHQGYASGSKSDADTNAAADDDARALRRLFLELPPLTSALRMITPPSAAFATQQELLQRLALAALDVNTMPSLAWKAPDQPLNATAQVHRAAAAQQAATALDAIWSLLARLKLEAENEIPTLFDEADRLIANLEFALSKRRAATVAGTESSENALAHLQGDPVVRERREPTLGGKEK